MVLLLGWSYYWGGLITGVVLFMGWSYYIGLISEVVLSLRWSYFGGVLLLGWSSSIVNTKICIQCKQFNKSNEANPICDKTA